MTKTRILSFLLCILLALSLLFSLPAFADISGEKTVRVGYVNVKGYEEGGEGEYKTGFGYEYFQKISYYTNWKYEYVYDSFSNLIEMLSRGEIDVLGNVTATDERARTMHFSTYAEGSESFYVFAKTDRDDLIDRDTRALAGKRIGVSRNSYQSALMDQYFAELGIPIEKVELEGTPGVVAALEAGQIDAGVMTDATDYGYAPLHLIGLRDYYFAVAMDRTDLLEELNHALSQIQSADPTYNVSVAKRYSFGTVAVNYLTSKEKEWLAERNNTIRIGYLQDNLPYSGTGANGELTGVVSIVTDHLRQNFGITVAYIPYSTFQAAEAALTAGQIDCLGPVYSDFYLAEQYEIAQTESLVTTTPVVLYKGELKTGTIAVSDMSVYTADVTKILFPEAEIVPCGSIEDCMNAVAAGKADCTVITSGKLNVLHQYSVMDRLSYSELMKNEELCLFTNRGETVLLTILNKAVYLSETQMKGAAFVVGADGTSVSIGDFLREHLAEVLLLFTLIVVILLWLVLKMYHAEKRAKMAEAEARELQKDAEAASQAKTVFLNNMSHDIRTPMNAILGFAELMKKDAQDPQKVEDYRSRIEGSGQYLLSIINNVLDMARIESGEITLDEDIMDVGNDDTTTLDILRPDMARKHLTFTHQLQVQHRYVIADRIRMQQILINLLSNAVKYTPEGGSIHLDTKEIPCIQEGFAAYVMTVSDTGIGMSREFQEHIFDAFSRERNTTDAKVIGTGLGMAIVKKLIDLMGGTITVESEPGKGSKFTVNLTLKIAEKPESEAEQPEDNTVSLTGKRILLAEDNELNAEIAIAILEDFGLQVDRAEDGVVCVDMLNKAEPGCYDLILMDIQMPNLDGYGATEKIRRLSDPAKANIPILAMTANAFAEDRQKAFDAGMNGHLAKPINVPELMKALAGILG